MATAVKSFRDLAKQAEELGLRPTIEPGSIFWTENSELENEWLGFADRSEGKRHPVVVVDADDRYVDVRMITSSVEKYQHQGILYTPSPDVELNRQSIILTKSRLHLRIPVGALRQAEYAGNVGVNVLMQVWVTETLGEAAEILGLRPKANPEI